jgi:hypothetical protein
VVGPVTGTDLGVLIVIVLAFLYLRRSWRDPNDE